MEDTTILLLYTVGLFFIYAVMCGFLSFIQETTKDISHLVYNLGGTSTNTVSAKVDEDECQRWQEGRECDWHTLVDQIYSKLAPKFEKLERNVSFLMNTCPHFSTSTTTERSEDKTSWWSHLVIRSEE